MLSSDKRLTRAFVASAVKATDESRKIMNTILTEVLKQNRRASQNRIAVPIDGENNLINWGNVIRKQGWNEWLGDAPWRAFHATIDFTPNEMDIYKVLELLIGFWKKLTNNERRTRRHLTIFDDALQLGAQSAARRAHINVLRLIKEAHTEHKRFLSEFSTAPQAINWNDVIKEAVENVTNDKATIEQIIRTAVHEDEDGLERQKYVKWAFKCAINAGRIQMATEFLDANQNVVVGAEVIATFENEELGALFDSAKTLCQSDAMKFLLETFQLNGKVMPTVENDPMWPTFVFLTQSKTDQAKKKLANEQQARQQAIENDISFLFL